jgi:L-fucose isomerase-like protein
MQQTTFGLIVANRDGFPDFLCREGREKMLKLLESEGYRVVVVSTDDTPHGSVSTLADARKCAELFKAHTDEIDGIIVTLPNFGDEKAVANTIRWSGLDVPVLVHAFPDDMSKMKITERGDAFCGKMSVANNLAQYDIPYTLTSLHTVDPHSEAFKYDLDNFAATCRVVKGLRGARIGAIGARPAAFNTVRYSEKILESQGISVETLDLSEAIGQANRLKDGDPAVKAKWEEIRGFVDLKDIPQGAVERMVKFGVVVDRWMADNSLNATAIQCWTALQEHFGIMPCTLMSMMSNKLLPSACETDVVGAVSMLALQLASDKPSMLLDWNNNYYDDPDRCVVFHCSNLPGDVFTCTPRMHCHPILSEKLGEEQTYGQLHGRIKSGPFTYLRASTDDISGRMAAYLGEAEFTDDPLDTFGGVGVVHVPGLQDLLYFICKNRFEHHVAANMSQVADAIEEALTTYMGWDVYHHE